MKSFYLSMLFILLLLTGCGGGGGGSSSGSKKVAYFIDAPVEGVSYSCNSISGLTGYDGSFEYEGDCTVTFNIGGVRVGEILASAIHSDQKVYVSESAGLNRSNISDPKLIKLLQFLQSLDENDDPSDGILISSAVSSDLNETLDLLSDEVTTEDIFTLLASIGKTLVDEDDAIAHYLATLNTDLGIPFLSAFNGSVAENSPVGTAVGTITITDAGINNITAITLSGTGAADFSATADGTITIANTLDFETRASYNLTAVATNASGTSAPVDVTITVTDISDSIPILSAFSTTLSENTATGTAVGTIAISDAGDSTITAITLSGTGASDFSVATDGAITVANVPDYERQASYTLGAIATNSAGGSASVNVSIMLADIPEIVPTLSPLITPVNENSAAGTAVGTIPITDAGDSAITAITLSGTGATDYSVATDGTITVANVPDYERQASYTLGAIATNSAGESASVAVAIAVANIVDTVPSLSPLITAVAENTTVGTTIDTISITDAGDSSITAITLSGTGASDFSVTTDGTITVVNAPDYETQPSYSLSAIATNAAGDSAPVAITIAVTNLFDTLPSLSVFSTTVLENTAVGVTVGTVTITDTGDSNISAITLSGAGASDFSVATNGTVTVVNTPNYETQTSYSLSAIATNAAGNSAPVAVTIIINDVADVVPTLEVFSETIVENMTVGSTIGSITIADDGDSAITAITLSGTGLGDFSVSTNGTITIANALDYAAQSIYNLNAMATNTAGDSNPVNMTIIIAPAPTIEGNKLIAGDAQANDEFGNAVAISGDYMVVGAWTEDPASITDAGSAYVYKKIGTGSYSEIAKLTAPTPEAFDLFGISVAIDGNYVVVGAQLDNGALDINDSGAAYVFKNNGSDNYSLFAELNILDPEVDDHFGWSVDISGDYAVVAADNKANHAGKVYVFKNNGADNFTQVATLAASDASAGDYFGYSVAINGDYIAIGSFFEDPFDTANAGSAYIFKNNGADSYTEIDKISAADAEAGDHFGRSIGTDGNYVVVGVYHEDPLGVIDAGSAYIFKNDGADSYNQVAKLNEIDAEADDEFGRSVGISGSYVVVGAHYEDPSGKNSAGSAYLFENDGTDNFSQAATFNASDATAGDRFGTSVSISGLNVIVGAPGNAGSAYLYTITP